MELTVNGRPYEILKQLGKGKGGYSYLARRENEDYVLKQIHHEHCDYYQFGDKLQAELRDYERLKALGIPMPRLLEADTAQERLLKEYIPGDTIYELAAKGQMKEEYLRQVEQMCEKLYAVGLNIDYYPTNFIPCRGILYYIDYECNAYMEEWDFAHWGKQYWTGKTAD